MAGIDRDYLIGEMIAAEKLGKQTPEARMSRVLNVLVEEVQAIIRTLEKGGIINLLWAGSEELTRKGEVPSYKEAVESLEMAQQTEVAEDRAPLVLHAIAHMINLMLDEVEKVDDQKINSRVKYNSAGRMRVIPEYQARKSKPKAAKLHAHKDRQ